MEEGKMVGHLEREENKKTADIFDTGPWRTSLARLNLSNSASLSHAI